MKEEVWRLVDSGACSPAYNMALDEAILTAHSEGLVPPTVRFYGWSPASLSIGYFQKAEGEVDLERVEREGLGFVRRPTGGRAVLHDRELTYSIIVAESYPGIPRGVTEAYRVLSEGLLLGFRHLGLDAAMVSLASEEEQRQYASMGSAACFDSPSWYELVVEGRKVAGSAQTRQKGVVLQHGSILLELDVEQLFGLLRFPSERVMERMKQQFVKKAVAINDILRDLGRPAVELDQVKESFERGLAEGLNVRFEREEPTSYEVELAEQLAAEKYGHAEWNLRR
ncbi:biotin/lipoate A/B protein ligase family protein [Paenibacillus sp. GD4]|jgi:lipoyl(octanoyl) transferase|uniref:lipoate--protein ligase family protein n=1 Tax=Paenibacillus sp. GD4 TaxID=3068890 RepID=UPI002796A9E6|nr:biotin/lipoate A/B protein ligase family protein [Paenibacillus sp. GD4]MDQ1909719.1 biotin/lipoate A/B protein ligase family protein [Paenibacillus sp. GD4]